jgi:methanol--5-hydroxybenzimidazolylcobamide Co-methyltransferase
MFCEIEKCLFSMAILRCRDMSKTWTKIVEIANKYGAVGGGDTACGFANTSMVLAEKNYIPRVFAAVDRVMAAIGTMVAVEVGAVGPDKDCGYEGPYIKAITGTPISMEGKTAACAHLSSVGNVAMCLPDIWSNESVQNVMLLGAMAPTVCFEMLAYDCRLMNEATKQGKAVMLRDLNADSDSMMDATAYMLRPNVVLDVSKELVKVDGHYARMKKAGELTVETLKKAAKDGKTKLDDKESMWLDTMGETFAGLPSDEGKFIEQMIPKCDKFDASCYKEIL